MDRSEHSQVWPCVYQVTAGRKLEVNIFSEYGVQYHAVVRPDGTFGTLSNSDLQLSGTMIGSTLSLDKASALGTLPAPATGVAPNGLPAGLYRGHALGPVGYPVTAVVFSDGSYAWLQGRKDSYSLSGRGSFAGITLNSAFEVNGYPTLLDYSVKAGTSGTLVGTLANPATTVTGFAAVWTGRPKIERFANLSTRGYVTPAQPPMIVGFVINGTTDDSFLVRGVGPALADFGVSGVLQMPRLRLMSSAGLQLKQSLAWGGEADWTEVRDTFARVGAFPLPEAGADAAFRDSQPPGPYTALIDGADGGSGIALVEVYEDPATSGGGSRLLNLSTRGLVSNGDRVLIGGFVITGTVPKSVLIRAVGPSLAPYAQGVFTVAKDPRIRIYAGGDSVNPIASNDKYWLGGNETEVRNARERVGAFALEQGSDDAAMVVALKPGLYTAVVDNLDADDGIALLEIYEIPPQ